jgi:hypothetical protein
MSQIQFQHPTHRTIRSHQRSRSFRASLFKFGRNIGIGILLAIGTGGYLIDTGVNAAIYDRSGQKIPDREVNSDRVNWQMLSAATGRKYNGVGLIEVGYGVCTGFLISTGSLNAPAYVLTNGHCQSIDQNPIYPKLLLRFQARTVDYSG